MSEERTSDVLGALPRKRPHRRSDKRATRDAPVSPADTPATAPPDVAAKPKSAPKPKSRKPTSAAAAPAPRSGKARRPATASRAQAGSTTARPADATAKVKPRLQQPSQPEGTPEARRSPPGPRRPHGADVVGTAVQAAAELAEIGLSVTARAVRGAISRLPRP